MLKESVQEAAINHVHNIQEQAFWKEVQNYANDLVAEGYDLSGYSWDDLADSYLQEQNVRGGGTLAQRNAEREQARQEREQQRKERQERQSNLNSRGRQSQSTSSSSANSPDRTDFSGNVRGGGTSAQRNAERAAQRDAAERERNIQKNTSTSGKGRISPSSQNQSGKNNPSVRPGGGSSTQQDTKTEPTTQTTQQQKPAPKPTQQPNTQKQRQSTQATSPAPAPTPRQPQSKDMDSNMKKWSAANPELAKKVKSGQSGFRTINPNAGKPSGFGSGARPSSTPSPSSSSMKSSRLSKALADKGSLKFKAESYFDTRYNELLQRGFYPEEAMKLMVAEGTKEYEDKKEMKAKNKKKIEKVALCPTIDEEVLVKYYHQWIAESALEGSDVSQYDDAALWQFFLEQVNADDETYAILEEESFDLQELRRSEKEGKGSPEERVNIGGKDYLVGRRGQEKRKGEMGGRRDFSGGEPASKNERGKKKGEKNSQAERLNPPERKNRMVNLVRDKMDTLAGKRRGSNWTGD